MQTRTHSLDSGRKVLRDSLPYVRFFIEKEYNILTVSCIERDHWILTEKIIEIFEGFPITFGHYTSSEFSYVKICEVLPALRSGRYLPMLYKGGK